MFSVVYVLDRNWASSIFLESNCQISVDEVSRIR